MFVSVGHVRAVFIVCKYNNREESSSTFRSTPSHHDENGRCCFWPDVTVRTDYRYVMHSLSAIIN
jgi:hypothetical protein